MTDLLDKVRKQSKANSTSKGKVEKYMKLIIEETGLSKKEIQKLVDDRIKEFKGLLSEEGALFVIAKELRVDTSSIKTPKKDIKNSKTTSPFDAEPITPKDRITKLEKGKIHAIHVFEGKEIEAIYEDTSPCYTCGKKRLWCGKSAACPVCDGLMTSVEYQQYEKKYNPKPKTAKKPKKQIFEEDKKEKKQKLNTKTKTEAFFDVEVSTKPEPKMELVVREPTSQAQQDEYPLVFEDAKNRVDNEIKLFIYVRNQIITKDDIFIFRNKYGKENEFITKSGVRKLMTAFGITSRIIHELTNVEKTKSGEWVAEIWAEARVGNGRTFMDIGICEQFEKNRKRTKHDTVATAVTRAINRAALGLFGFGMVSKEEVLDDTTDKPDYKGSPFEQ